MGSEAERALEAVFRSPGGDQSPEEEEKGLEEVQDPEEAQEEVEELPQEDSRGFPWTPGDSTSLPSLRPWQRQPQPPRPRDMLPPLHLLSLPPPLQCVCCPH